MPKSSETKASKSTEDDDQGGGCWWCLALVAALAAAVVVALYLLNVLPGDQSPLDPPIPSPPPPTPLPTPGQLVFQNQFTLPYAPSCVEWVPGTSWVYVCNSHNQSLHLFLVEGITGTWSDQQYAVALPFVSPSLVTAADDGMSLYVSYLQSVQLSTFGLDPSTGELYLWNTVQSDSFPPIAIAAIAESHQYVFTVGFSFPTGRIDAFDDNGPQLGLSYDSSYLLTSFIAFVDCVVVNEHLYTLVSGAPSVSLWEINRTSNGTSPLTHSSTWYLPSTGPVRNLVVSADESVLYATGLSGTTSFAIDPESGNLTLIAYNVSASTACVADGDVDLFWYGFDNATSMLQFEAPALSPLSPPSVQVVMGATAPECFVLSLFDTDFVSLVSGSTVTTWRVSTA